MEKREIAEVVEKRPYFEVVASNPVTERDDGTKDMGELSPFLICGGRNTERFYFTHINDKTDYRFNIRPKYFGDESSYTETFPKRIKEVLDANNDVKIFCVFDWDTIFGNEAKLNLRSNLRQKYQMVVLRYAPACRVLSIGFCCIL